MSNARRSTTSATDQIEDAVHVALSEIPGAPLSDLLDCVFGIVGADVFDANEELVVKRIASLR